MRHELSNHLASSAINVFRMLQTVVDDADLQKAHQHALQSQAHPNFGGCVDSPEASTIILMLVGSLGIYYGSQLFLKLARRRHAASPAA